MKHHNPFSVFTAVIILGAAPFIIFAQGDTGNRPPIVKPIHAELTPPTTVYTVEASDPDGDPLTYRWEGDVGCGVFRSTNGASASWTHPNGDPPLLCPHTDGTSHDGTIFVHVSDGPHSVLCSYDGSEPGNGPECLPDAPGYYPSIFDDWTDMVYEYCYYLWIPLLLLSLVLARYLYTNGLFVGRKEEEDPCAQLRKAEAAARAKYAAAKSAFDTLDRMKSAVDSAAKHAAEAARGAEAAARAAGGRWSAHGSTDWEGEHIEVHKEGWQDKELGKKADDAISAANEAKAAAKKAKENFDQQGGEAAWKKAKDEMESARAAWEKANAALRACVCEIGAPKSTPPTPPTGGDGGGKTGPTGPTSLPGTTDGGGTTPPPTEPPKPPKVEHTLVCYEGDKRNERSESVTVQILDLQSVRLMQDKIYSDAGNEAMKFVDYLQTIKDVFMLGKSIKGGVEGYLHGSLEGASDAVGFPDFLTWYDKGIDELTKSMYHLFTIMQDKQQLGDYWLEYQVKSLTLTCARSEVCSGNRWVKHCELTIADNGMTTHRTEPEQVFDSKELQRAISRLFTRLRNRYRGDQDRTKKFTESCNKCL